MQPSLRGAVPESTTDQDSGSLYDAATVHGNREAAAQCASKAEEAMQERDFDKAVRTLLRYIVIFIDLDILKGVVSATS